MVGFSSSNVEISCTAVRKLISYLLTASSTGFEPSLCHVMPRLAMFSVMEHAVTYP